MLHQLVPDAVQRGAKGQLFLFSDASKPNQADSPPLVGKVSPEWYELVEEFLGQSDSLYPGITDWWKKRVIPGLENQSRLCKIVAVDGKIAALAIAKLHTKSSKLCTLRVAPEFRKLGLGQRLLRSTLGSLLAANASKIHFTISEEIFHECGNFFTPYGFQLGHWRKGWYVRGMYEMAYWARASAIQHALDQQMTLFTDRSVVVMSIKPEHALAIQHGIKRVEFRRRFSRSVKCSKALFYSTAPAKQFQLSATITDIVEGSPEYLWNRFNSIAGCGYLDFKEYFAGSNSGFALPLADVHSFATPLSHDSPFLQSIQFRPPQSYAIVHANSPLIRAVHQANLA